VRCTPPARCNGLQERDTLNCQMGTLQERERERERYLGETGVPSRRRKACLSQKAVYLLNRRNALFRSASLREAISRRVPQARVFLTGGVSHACVISDRRDTVDGYPQSIAESCFAEPLTRARLNGQRYRSGKNYPAEVTSFYPKLSYP
jgi:hypothetical protein